MHAAGARLSEHPAAPLTFSWGPAAGHGSPRLGVQLGTQLNPSSARCRLGKEAFLLTDAEVLELLKDRYVREANPTAPPHEPRLAVSCTQKAAQQNNHPPHSRRGAVNTLKEGSRASPIERQVAEYLEK